MKPTEWNQIFEVFHAAREKSGGERVALLDTACGENTLLRKAVEELLNEDEAACGFLSEPLFSSLSRDHHESRIAPGQRFGRYITLARIGRGGMGEVWSAHDTDLNRPVALKFLSSEALAVLDTHQITHEARAASALNHPGIVTIHEIVQSESTFAIVMELVEGTSLRELCGKPIRIAEVLAIGLQIAEALAAAHDGGTIHGDIKPENILLHRGRYVKVLDFGLARKVTAETIVADSRPALGTLRYMSPEQARGDPLTPTSDVFSFGLVLYELTTGRHAFPALSPLDTARAILTQEPSLPSSMNPSVPVRLDLIIRAMLAKEAAARPTIKEVAARLTELQAPKKIFPVPAVWKWVIAAVFLMAVCFAAWRWKQARNAGKAPLFRQITTLVSDNRATAAAISPDGTLAAYANVDGIFVRAIQDGETKPLPAPDDYIFDRLAWFSDGTKLIASGFSASTHVPSIWLISAIGAAPRLLRTNARQGSPSPDGTCVAFVTKDTSDLWVIGSGGEDPRRLVSGSEKNRFELVFWFANGRRLGFQHHYYSNSGDERKYGSVPLAHPEFVSEGMDLRMNSAAALRDARLMFLKWDPDNTSSQELWEVKTDSSSGAVLGKPRMVASVPGDGTGLLDLSVSMDGKRTMVLRRSDQRSVFVGDFDDAPPRISNIRRLTFDERTSYPHAWTADSRAVIFESNRNGNYDLFKQDLSRHTPDTIVATPYTEMLPQLSPDGHFVLYTARPHEDQQPWYYKPGTYKLMRIPVDGGLPEEVPIGGPLDEFRCAVGPGGRCVLRNTQPGRFRTYYDLDSIWGKGRELARTKWSSEVLGDWDISPDGTEVAIPNHDSHEARIRVVSLDTKQNEPREREIVLPGLSDLRGLTWAADGRGWFVSVDTTVGNRLLYVYLDGRFHPLGDIQGWAVPSPDRRRVAFMDRIIATNAWLIERH